MTTTIRTTLTFLLLLLTGVGCSSWGGKINNTEGVNYYARGDYDQALTAFQTASRLNPEDPEVYYNIASTYQQQALRYQDPALLTQAETNYRICLQKNPTRETTVCCYRGLATVLNQKKDEKQALKVLQEWEEKEPTSVEPKLEIAYLLEAQGKNRESADALTKIKDWAPNDYRAFYKLGLIEEKMGNDAEALEHLRAAARLNPAHQDITNKIIQLEGKESAPKVSPSANENTQAAVSNAPPFETPAEPPVAPARTSSVQSDLAPPLDGFTPVAETPEPVFDAIPRSEPVPQAPPETGFVPEETPSYNTPAPGSLPAATPDAIPSTPPSEIDSLFGSDASELSAIPPTLNSTTPAQARNVAGTISLPDGTGTPTHKLAYTGAAVPKTSSAASTATDSTAVTTNRKSNVGNANPGPPRTSVGVPF
jgi:Flp pilus assembly protein TadD